MCGEDHDDVTKEDDLINLPLRPADKTFDVQVNDFKEESQTYSKEDEIKILVATDIHVGAHEEKAKIGDDSFQTFEEVLQIATEKKVDMVLLGGDLFHKNKPSRESEQKVMNLLRRYCFNDRDVLLEYLSDPLVDFKQKQYTVNFDDPNINVGLPIFTIHGNHDDMAGKDTNVLDKLHIGGLLNHFGKVIDISNFKISPMILKKGKTRLAIYGIGSQRDDRLFRAFKDKSIKILRHEDEHHKYFNIFVLHQNRAKRSHQRTSGAYLPEDFIPGFMDLVIWGHEHGCKKDLEYFTHSNGELGSGFYILQPGSTVATSICPDETIQKNVFLIKVRGQLFKSTPIPLQTTRQIYMESITLDKVPPGIILNKDGSRPAADTGKPLPDEKIIIHKINEMIAKAKSERGQMQPALPLLRLVVTYAGPWSHMQPINACRIGARFSDKVANPQEMIITRKAVDHNKIKMNRNIHAINNVLENASAETFDDVIDAYYESLPISDNLTILDTTTIKEAINQYVDEDATAKANKDFSDIITKSMQTAIDALMQISVPEITYDENGEVKVSNFVKLVAEDMKQFKLNKYSRDLADETNELLNQSDDVMEDD